MTLITGNTYPHRQQLRAMGGEWDASVKGWRVPEDAGDRARLLWQAVARIVAPRGYGCRAGFRTTPGFHRVLKCT